jgi:hypothetical protein
MATVYVIGGHIGGHCELFPFSFGHYSDICVLVAAILLRFSSSSAYTYSPLLCPSRINRFLLPRVANHRDFMFRSRFPASCFCQPNPISLSVFVGPVRYRHTLSFLVSLLDPPVPYAVVCLIPSSRMLRIHSVFVLDIIIVFICVFTP